MPLTVVPTPIGNLEDITLRALRYLREVDLVACEDTRRTGRLLAHYELKKYLFAYHEHNEERLAPELAARAKTERVALVTDAGTPLVSDPGFRRSRPGDGPPIRSYSPASRRAREEAVRSYWRASPPSLLRSCSSSPLTGSRR